ncbi:tetratricopeptide repeat protein [Candidatus Dependentiae bacterium]
MLIIMFIGYFLLRKRGDKNTIYTGKDYVGIAKYFKGIGKDRQALGFYEKAVKIDPGNKEANISLARYYDSLGQYDKAIESYKKVASKRGVFKKFFYDIGYIYYYKKGDNANAAKYIEKYIDSLGGVCDNVGVHIILYDTYAKLGNFAKAREHNKKIDSLCLKQGLIKKTYKEWKGQDVCGKTVLLRDNVGIGDIFCWLRFAKILKSQGARVILETRKFLIPILTQSGCIDQCFVIGQGKIPYFDYQVIIGKIASYFVKSENDLKTDVPYMAADQGLINKWGDILSKDRNFKIGICWDPCQYKDKLTGKVQENRRAMPFCYFLPLTKLKNVSLYSLQQVNGLEQLNGLPVYCKLKTFDKTFDKTHGSFSDTAAVMKNLDLVITVDTSVAHLAGALGVPVWMLLPVVADWRWLSAKNKTALYPTMRLFRQSRLGDWESVMSDVYCQLCEVIKDINK